MENVYLNRANILTPFGLSVETNWKHLIQGETAVSKIDSFGHLHNFHAGKISATIEKEIESTIENVSHYTRLEKFGIATLQSIIDVNTLSSKTALFISTTKGNIDRLSESIEAASISSFAQKIADYFGFISAPIIICNACVSGVMAVNTAKRMIQMNRFEDAYVLALDELTDFVLTGFNSFQAMDFDLCKPFDAERKGVNLGEAAACVYLSKKKTNACFQIMGEASINDANHISGPSRTGEGLVKSVESAMKEAGINAEQIDYISAHGTATLYNDEMEAIAFERLNLAQVPINSLKAYFGHTLGASGLLEIILAIKQVEENTLLKSLQLNHLGTSSKLSVLKNTSNIKATILLKTSSGFGGSNAVIILKKLENEAS